MILMMEWTSNETNSRGETKTLGCPNASRAPRIPRVNRNLLDKKAVPITQVKKNGRPRHSSFNMDLLVMAQWLCLEKSKRLTAQSGG